VFLYMSLVNFRFIAKLTWRFEFENGGHSEIILMLTCYQESGNSLIPVVQKAFEMESLVFFYDELGFA